MPANFYRLVFDNYYNLCTGCDHGSVFDNLYAFANFFFDNCAVLFENFAVPVDELYS